MKEDIKTPAQLGYSFPAEWHKHSATWLSWPHKEASWPGKIHTVYSPYCKFIKAVTQGETVCINVADAAMESFAKGHLINEGVDLNKIKFYHQPTNDAWCRDHGPIFVRDQKTKELAILDFDYNAWGEKYQPFDLDNQVPSRIADALNLPCIKPSQNSLMWMQGKERGAERRSVYGNTRRRRASLRRRNARF